VTAFIAIDVVNLAHAKFSIAHNNRFCCADSVSESRPYNLSSTLENPVSDSEPGR
jgi:hypothetical protein